MARARTAEPGLFDGLEAGPEPVPHAGERGVSVALDRPLREDLTYALPPGVPCVPGGRVEVPLGTRRIVGVVTGAVTRWTVDSSRVKSVLRAIDREPILGEDLLELSARMAEELACSRGQALAAMLPAHLRRERARRTEGVAVLLPADPARVAELEARAPDRFRILRLLREAGGSLRVAELRRAAKCSESPVKTLARGGFLRLEWREVAADPLLLVKGTPGASPRPELSDEQRAAVDAIAEASLRRTFAPFLLFGVTGSGKTEVYLRALERVLEAGRSSIVLVPEISLTPQTVERFRSRFREVAVLHSHLTDAERLGEWRRIRAGEARVVVGARSAVFAPVVDLGLVVVDEEHEPSFKQASTPRYHAREVAWMRARHSGAAVVLGSATPSLETWQRTLNGELTCLRLTRRLAGGELPAVRIADLRHEKPKDLGLGAGVDLTRALRNAIAGALERKEKVILFLNRRGFAPVLWCSACGKTVGCTRCAVSLTLHQRIGKLVCHLCGRETAVPAACPACGGPRPRFLGSGTERIEQLMWRVFPKAHVARMDSDTTLARGSHESILERFRGEEVDILVGTQMIAKGLDIREVSVVGVVNADSTLHVPEFQAAERTFQLVAQVAGRAGRGTVKGDVIVQTALPSHPAIACAVKHDFEAFARGELEERRRHRYPPFTRLARVLFEHRDAARVKAAAEAAALRIEGGRFPGIDVLGPAPAPIERIQGKARWHFLVRCDPREAFTAVLGALQDVAFGSFAGLRATVDVDPASAL